jgi:hypothetical protein
MREMLRQLEAISVKCSTCKHSHGKTCLKYMSDPPEDVRAKGCEEWEFDGVPF